ncbi:MAG: molybdenum-pterin binding [Puniceicoccaceae bacterium 5H]|nr:MAG: molybdenum-pterin binding [Puniceicoccaceae bacterium 5H]
MKITARNQLLGKVTAITLGPINAEVTLELAGGLQITSIVTRHAVESLQLEVGKTACALIKASNVMLGVEE